MKIPGPKLVDIKAALEEDVPIADCQCGLRKPRTFEHGTFCTNCGGKVSNQERDPAKSPEATWAESAKAADDSGLHPEVPYGN